MFAGINTCANTRETADIIHPKDCPGSGSSDYNLGYRVVGKQVSCQQDQWSQCIEVK